jgi:hypothetical protein
MSHRNYGLGRRRILAFEALLIVAVAALVMALVR